jgi:hypothetical protein
MPTSSSESSADACMMLSPINFLYDGEIIDDFEVALPAPRKYSHNDFASTSRKEAVEQSKRYRAAAGLVINVEEAARWLPGQNTSNSSPDKVAQLFRRSSTP